MSVRFSIHAFAFLVMVGSFVIVEPSRAFSLGESQKFAHEAYISLRALNFEAAIGKFDQAIESRLLGPEELANALLNRAVAKQHLNNHEAAIADYSAALAIAAMANDLRATALYNRGLSRHKMRHLPDAIEDYTSALLLNAALPQAFLSRGQALRESGQLLFALSDFERALLFGHPNGAYVNYLMGLTYEQLKRPPDARRHYELALQLNPALKQAVARLQLIGTIDQNEAGRLPTSTRTLGTSEMVKPSMKHAIEPPQMLLTDTNLPTDNIETGSISATSPSEVSFAEAEPNADVAPESPVQDTVKDATLPKDVANQIVAEEPPQAGSWTIQLASASSEQGAKSTWANLQKKSTALSDLVPDFVRADLGAKGVFYRVRLTGFEDQQAAQIECKRLKAKRIDCYVSRAEG
jgi:tetratricopeptide (TPR) repeat protein